MVRQSIASAPVFGAATVASQLTCGPLPMQRCETFGASARAGQDRSTALRGRSKPLNVHGPSGDQPVNRAGIALVRIELPGPTGNQGKTICYQGRFRTS